MFVLANAVQYTALASVLAEQRGVLPPAPVARKIARLAYGWGSPVHGSSRQPTCRSGLRQGRRRLHPVVREGILMGPKENALRILRFDNPERIVSELPMHVVGYQGCNDEGYDGGGHGLSVGATWTDIWGVVWKKELEGVMGFPQHHPLAQIEDLRTYRWPDPDDERICGRIYSAARRLPPEEFLTGTHRETLWEKAYILVGMQNLMEYFFSEPNYVREILRHIMEYDLAIARHYLAIGIEVAALGDDLGTQQGPLLGPAIVDEFLVPEYRRLFEVYRRKGVILYFHSCGRIDSMLDTFLDLGVDILNPVQATANDLNEIRRVTQGRMALSGAVSTDTIIRGFSCECHVTS